MRTRLKVYAVVSALALGLAGGGVALADGSHDGDVGTVPGEEGVSPAMEVRTAQCVGPLVGPTDPHETASNGFCNITHDLPNAPFAVVLTNHGPLFGNHNLPYQLGWEHSGDPTHTFSVRALNTRGEVYTGTFAFSYVAYSNPAPAE
jgi:hypothetical protein